MLKGLPKELTSYDVLKTLAVVLMIFDHIGHHFFVDEMWFRVLGRLCIPIWFFLIGYARSDELRPSFFIGAGLLVVSSVLAGQYILPLNILVTIMVLRHMRNKMALSALSSPAALRGMFLILLFLTFPSAMVFEYGSIAGVFVIFGFFVRNKEAVYEQVPRKYMLTFVIASFFCFYMMQGLMLPSVSGVQAIVMMLGFVGIGYWLWNFRAVAYASENLIMSRSFISLFQFFGRKTLEVYVGHVLIFRALAMYLYPEKYAFMDWHFIPLSVVEPFIQ